LISSHVLSEIEQVCDRIIILRQGKRVVEGVVSALLGTRDRIQVRISRAGEAQALLAVAPGSPTLRVRAIGCCSMLHWSAPPR
jgi:ABC-2 type transport system ATP-binding protein